MVYKPWLEPEPGLGLWQALNSGLAQDFQSPSPPKPGQSQGFEPKPGPIHHYSLATDRPRVFKPNLAYSLGNLAKCLSHLGRQQEALEAKKEAVEMY
jgi:hypothetical protein